MKQIHEVISSCTIDLIDLLKTNSHGFVQGCEKSSGKELVRSICDTLIYIFPRLKRFKERRLKIPSYFSSLYSYDIDSGVFVQDYNNPEEHKHKLKPLDAKVLHTHAQNLYKCLTYPSIHSSRLDHLRNETSQLASSIDMMATYLNDNNEGMKEIHLALTATRTPGDGSSDRLRFIQGTCRFDDKLIQRYAKLEAALKNKAVYEFILLNEYAPVDRKLKYVYVEELQLASNVEVYCYHRGNALGTLWFVWNTNKAVDMQKTNEIMQTYQLFILEL